MHKQQDFIKGLMNGVEVMNLFKQSNTSFILFLSGFLIIFCVHHLPISIEMAKPNLRGVWNFTKPEVVSGNEILEMYTKYINP